jgi:hypothetical protein
VLVAVADEESYIHLRRRSIAMNTRKSYAWIVALVFVTLLVACGGPAAAPTPMPPTATAVPTDATPVPPTATSIPPTATSVPPTATPIPPTTIPVPPSPTPAASVGSLAGTVDIKYGTPLMAVKINEIQSNGVISVTLNAETSLSNAQGPFVLDDLAPGQYLLFNHPLLIALTSGQGELKLATSPFKRIEYDDAIKLPIDSFKFADKDGKSSPGFLFANGQVVLFTVKAGERLQIVKPLRQ